MHYNGRKITGRWEDTPMEAGRAWRVGSSYTVKGGNLNGTSKDGYRTGIATAGVSPRNKRFDTHPCVLR